MFSTAGIEFCMIITWIGSNWSILTVYIPYILAIKLFGLVSKCSMYIGKDRSIWLISFSCMVFIMNRLSFEKKKKWPLAPAPSPALAIYLIFLAGSKDSKRCSSLILFNERILLKVSGAYCFTMTRLLRLRVPRSSSLFDKSSDSIVSSFLVNFLSIWAQF